VVVDREPQRGDLGLAGDRDAVGRRHEPGPRHGPRQGELDGNPAVADLDLEVTPLAQRAPRGDDELLAEAHPARPAAVHLDALDVQADEVEVQAAEVAGCPRVDVGLPVEAVGGGVVVDLEVVGADVVAAVAIPRVVRVPDPRRARDARAAVTVVVVGER
jgi:hypothetical protein